MNGHRALVVAAVAMLGAACSHPVVPEWEERAHEALDQYRRSYFAGDNTADREFQHAADALASTGRIDLRARGELIRCALATAALDFDRCRPWQALEADASPADRAYGALLSGKLEGLDAKAVPPQYAALAGARDTAARGAALKGIDDPVSRLIGAGALFRAGELAPEGVELAVATASGQGWRRPLLAWLSVQARLAEAAGDAGAAQRVRRRIEVVAPVAR